MNINWSMKKFKKTKMNNKDIMAKEKNAVLNFIPSGDRASFIARDMNGKYTVAMYENTRKKTMTLSKSVMSSINTLADATAAPKTPIAAFLARVPPCSKKLARSKYETNNATHTNKKLIRNVITSRKNK